MAAFWATIFFSQNKKTVKDYLLKGFLSSLSFSRLFFYYPYKALFFFVIS